ncbi:MAG: tyrosine-type recombinase/integrase [Bacillota bacterium]|nr:tyrosine-type recombinase/integrase [Bacillota bacterium]
MRGAMDPDEIPWTKYPAVAVEKTARKWLESQALLGLARNTVEAYARGLQEFLQYCARGGITPVEATRGQVVGFVGELRRRPSPRGANVLALDSGVGLSNATLQQRLTCVRLFFDYVTEEGLRETNPVGRGKYKSGNAFRVGQSKGLIPRYKRLPWIPDDGHWDSFLLAAREEPIRNRCMIGLAYDAALRREELCLVESRDIDPAHRTVRIRAETTKSRKERLVPYSAATSDLLKAYLLQRHTLSKDRGPLFLSESRRNYGKPITMWTWSKVIRRIADRAGLPQMSTHTLRHLCLTDLARAGWDLHEIARFAGHRSLETTQQYVHLSCRDLALKVALGMDQVHQWRAHVLAQTLLEPEERS